MGLISQKTNKKLEKTLGFSVYNLGINPETKGIFIIDEDGIKDAFGAKIGFKAGDELVSLNGKALGLETFRATRSDFINNSKEGDNVDFVVLRKDGDKKVETKLSAKIFIPEVAEKNPSSPMENPTDAQAALRRAWLVPEGQ